MHKKNMIFGVFCLGLMALSFIGGAWCIWGETSAGHFLSDAFTGAVAWKGKTMFASDAKTTASEVADSAMQLAKADGDERNAYNGYTLITLRANIVYLVNMQGKTVYRWEVPFYTMWPNPTHIPERIPEDKTYIAKAQVFPNGDLLVLYQGVAMPYGFGLVKVDKQSHVIWRYSAMAHHDFSVDAKGNITTLVHNYYDARYQQSIPSEFANQLPYPLMEDSIVVLSPEGKEVKRLSLLKAIYDSPYASILLHDKSDLDYSDMTHANSVMELEPDIAPHFPQFKAGQILVSMRNLNAVAVVDLDEGKVVWMQKGAWEGQHDAHFDKDGTLLLLDNLGGVVRGIHFSRVFKVDPSAGQITWSYTGLPGHAFFTYGGGRLQHLPNDDILVTDTLKGRVFEINPTGNVIWNWSVPLSYMPRSRDFPPYGDGEKYKIFPGIKAMVPNLVTAVTSASRLSPDEVKFISAGQ